MKLVKTVEQLNEKEIYSELSFNKMLEENKYETICQAACATARNLTIAQICKDKEKVKQYTEELKHINTIATKCRKDFFKIDETMQNMEKLGRA